MSTSHRSEPEQQVPDFYTRELVRRNPEIRFRYTFGDRKFNMDGRPLSDFTDFEINLKPVPKANATDIRHIAKTYRQLMKDPEVIAMQEKQHTYTIITAIAVLALFYAVIVFTS